MFRFSLMTAMMVGLTFLSTAAADDPRSTLSADGWKPAAEPEDPTDKNSDKQGWTEVSDTYGAPAKATKAVVELHLRWAPGGQVEWSEVRLTETSKPTPRTVRLAAVHFRPSGKSP